METREHFKLYKHVKKWCVMAIAMVATAFGMASVKNVDASVNTNEPTIAQTSNDDSAADASVAQNTVTLHSEAANQSAAATQNSAASTTTSAATNDTQEQVSSSAASQPVASSASATQAQPSVVTEEARTVSSHAAAPATKNGWVNENNHWTYYNNGNVQSGRSYSYLPTINGQGHSWYLVDNGVVQSGVQKWAGTYYDFDNKTYQRVDNNYVQSQWGDWYLFGNDGRIQTKVQKWAGTYYYFDPVTYLRVNNDYRQSQWGDWYMFGSDGRIATKVYKWAGTYYYFDPVTYLRVDNDYCQSQWGDWYLFGNDGRILSGLQKWAGNYYYFNSSTYLKETNTNFTVDGLALHADASGIVTGQTRNSSFLLSIYQAAIDGWHQYGVLPSVTAAQAILESAWGESALATEGHNLFGIKGSYNGQSIVMRTAEYGGGGYYYINDAFRRYPSNYESVVDHGRFLASNSRYHNLLWQRNYAVVTNDLHADGYATDPAYASSLNNVIRTYGLDSWDRQAF